MKDKEVAKSVLTVIALGIVVGVLGIICRKGLTIFLEILSK